MKAWEGFKGAWTESIDVETISNNYTEYTGDSSF